MAEEYRTLTLASGATITRIVSDFIEEHPKFIESGDFWERFTSAEQEAIATHTNPKAKAFITYLMINRVIDLRYSKLVTALGLMEQAGIIGAGRADEILA